MVCLCMPLLPSVLPALGKLAVGLRGRWTGAGHRRALETSWCCGSNFTFLFLSFSPPFLFPSPLQVLSLDKSVSLLPVLSILPACLFPANAPFSGQGQPRDRQHTCSACSSGSVLAAAVPGLTGSTACPAGALECLHGWSLPSSLRCGSAGQGLPGCARYPAWCQAGGCHCH